MREQHLVLDEDANIVWSGRQAPTEAVMKILRTLLPDAVFETYAVHHVVNFSVPILPQSM